MTKRRRLICKKRPFEELIELIENNALVGMKSAIEKDGLDVNMADRFGNTALHHAAIADKIEILDILISHPQIRINAKNKKNKTPLMFAAEYGKVRSVEFLLSKGADASCADKDDHTALSLASTHDHLECVELLLKSKNSISKQKGKEKVYKSIYKSSIIELLKKLILETPDGPYYVQHFGFLILHNGCENGSLDSVKFVVEKGIMDINSIEYDGRTALQIALSYSSLEIADYLIQKGAILTVTDSEGSTAYIYAACYDRSQTFLQKYAPDEIYLFDLFKSLIWEGRSKTLRLYAEKCLAIQYPNGPNILKHAIFYAFEKSRYYYFEIFMEQIFDKEFIIQLTKDTVKYSYELCISLFERVLKLEPSEAQIKVARTDIFVLALEKDNESICKYLLRQGLDPNEAAEEDSYLLRASRKYYDFGLVECLLKYGANPHVRNKDGYSPLLLAAYNGRKRAFAELFKVDKDLCQRSNDGLTPLLAACKSGEIEIVRALVETGACLTDVDNKNRNCLHFGAENNNNFHLRCLIFFLIEKLRKRDFKRMITAADSDGNRPVYKILSINDMYELSYLLEKIPILSDPIDTPNQIKIRNSSHEMCSICRDDLITGDSLKKLTCKHVFHEECYSEWSKQKDSCPNCEKTTFGVKKPKHKKSARKN